MKNLQTMYGSTSQNARNITPDTNQLNELTKHLSECLKKIESYDGERESNERNIFRDVLLKQAFPNNDVNGVGNIDIAIMNKLNHVGVIFEYKRVSNVTEMMSDEKLNVKSFQELIQYYLGEITGHHKNGRIEDKNSDKITGIVTNAFSWYIINSIDLYNYFGKYNKLKQEYIDWSLGKKGATSTDYLRDEIISPWIDKAIKGGIKIGRFHLRDMVENNHSMKLKDKYQRIFYRFLSPQNLLAEGITTDANELNSNFYNELLYLMGLKEYTKSGSKLIRVSKESDYTLARNAMNQIKIKHSELSSERLEDISIQLTVTWINRILFLKLLESQLYSFNDDDSSYKFLNEIHLHEFGDVYDLFFAVLAKYVNDRSDENKEEYPEVPYLNSSLFEPTELEKKYLGIDSLRNRAVPLFKHTVLKDNKKSKLPILNYLLNFLESYSFSTSYSNNDKDNDLLINASVLGLIFEKINGYKDGSYFTPGWICMGMAHEAVSRAVIKKVNDVLDKDYKTLKDIKEFVSFSFINTSTPAKAAHDVDKAINSIKVCDPSVGSGHFLVSILNEIIAIKSYLGVLFDTNGDPAKFKCSVVNDDLLVSVNGKRFQYLRTSTDTHIIQETLFEEKKYLIENCLFGVDINPNSVGICHLRLWIELLKNSYYQFDNHGEHLTTMPNIDINIKTHNSLIHMYGLKTPNNFNKSEFKEYCRLVDEYKNTSDKNKEESLKDKIAIMERDFNSSISTPAREEFSNKLKNSLGKMHANGQTNLLSETEEEKNKRLTNYLRYKELSEEYTKKYNESLEIDPFYTEENAMEWRISFPEVLDENGDYDGFDLIIGNPPYIFARNNSFSKEEKEYYTENYDLAKYQLNTYHMFIELAYNLLKTNGVFAYIVPNNILTIQSNLMLRSYLVNKTSNLKLINSKDKLFKDAAVDNCIAYFDKNKPSNITLMEMLHHDNTLLGTVDHTFFSSNKEEDDEPIFSLLRVKYAKLKSVYTKILENNRLKSLVDIKAGIQAYEVGKGIGTDINGHQSKLDKDNRIYHSEHKIDATYLKYLSGSDVKRYQITWGNKNVNEKYIKYGDNLAAPRKREYFDTPRLLVRQIVSKDTHSLFAAYLNEKNVINDRNSMIVLNKDEVLLKFILGIINSSIETFWFAMKFDKFQRKTFPQFKVAELKEFPIPQASKTQIQHLSSLVSKIMEETKNNNGSKAESLDLEIDNYVMNLYGLSDEEKDMVKQFNF